MLQLVPSMELRHPMEALRLIALAMGTVTRKRGVWHIDGTTDTVEPKAIGALRRAHLIGGYDNAITDDGKWRVKMLNAKTHAPAIGSEVTYRCPREVRRGTVVQANGNRVIVVPSKRVGEKPSVDEIRRPSVRAPWKLSTTNTIGWYAPGGYHNDPSLWAVLASWPGLVPEAWYTPDTGEVHTLARLRRVHARLASMHARGTTPEERAACKVFGDGLSYTPDKPLMWVRARAVELRTSSFHQGRDVAVANYLDAVLAGPDAAEIEAAEEERAYESICLIWSNARGARGAPYDWKPDPISGKRSPPPAPTLADVLKTMRIAPDTHEAVIYTRAYARHTVRRLEVEAQIAAKYAKDSDHNGT